MDTLIKHSMLNPLATCFVPSNIKIFEDKTEKYQSNVKKEDNTSVVNEKSTAVMKFNTTLYPERRGNDEKLDLLLPRTSDVLCAKPYFARLVNEIKYFTKDYIKFGPFKTGKCTTWIMADVTALLKFILAALLSFHNQQNLSITYDAVHHEDVDSLKEYKSDELEKCNCPPMFGCIIPPDFFGNPFGLNYSCNKKQAHVCHYSVTSGAVIQKCNTKDKDLYVEGKSKLEQYSNEVKEIVKDVCEEVNLADYNGTKENSMFDQSSAVYSDVHNNAAYKSNENVIFNKVEAISSNKENLNLKNIKLDVEIPIGSPIDDFHPLLDEGVSMEVDNESPVVQKFIERSFSPKRKRLLSDPEEIPEVVCNPPCSVWCDSLPWSARNAYKKFIKDLSEVEQDFSSYSNYSQNFIQSINKPLSKRSFSANSSTRPEKRNLKSFIAVSDESLLRKRTDSCGELSLLNQRMKVERSRSLPLRELRSGIKNGTNFVKRSKDNLSSTWGPFDGEDSLWQPFPECVPSNEYNLIHKSS